MMRMLDVCSGIGGISLGAHLTGEIETVAFSEVEPFPSAVLAHHWPHIPNMGDIHGISKARLASIGLLPIDILAAGFPCQPFSHAGKRKGQADTRNLWPEMARLVGDLEPEWFVGENVFGLLSIGVERGKHHGYFGDIQRDLARLGYASGWCVLSAADAGAPHLRKRVFILANRDGERVERAMRFLADAQQRGWHPGQQWNTGWQAGATLALRGGQRGQVADAGYTEQSGRGELAPGNGWRDASRDVTASCGGALADAEGDGWRTWWPESAGLSGQAGTERNGDMGDADRRECRGWTNSEGHQSHGAATRWHESDGEPESAGERSDTVADPAIKGLSERRSARQPQTATEGRTGVESEPERSGYVAHAGGGQCQWGQELPGGWDQIPRGQQLRDDAGGCDGSGVGLADANESGLQERDRCAGTRGACTAPNKRGEGQAQPRLGHTVDGLSRWMVGRFPVGPGQAQEDWEAPRTVTGKVAGRAAKLKALGNSVMPVQIYPVFAAIVATEQVVTQGESAA